MSLDALLGTIRAAGDPDGDDPELVSVTRLRVVRSLETRARSRHQLVGIATTVAILLAGTVSWALATGQIATLWSPSPAPRAQPVVAPPRPPRPSRRREPAAPSTPQARPEPPAPPAVAPPAEAIAVDPRPSPPPEAVAPVPSASPPVPRPVPAPARRPMIAPPVEALYRRAHQLHFHGRDPAAALAAWDAYLAAEPDGRFSVEARYNRALLMVRLGRYAEARAALAPFARGAVVPEGYRQAEAEQLVERLAHYE